MGYPDVTVAGDTYPHPSTSTKAIRQKCLDCCAGSITEVDKCDVTTCPLWTRRFGRRPETALKAGRNVTMSELDA